MSDIPFVAVGNDELGGTVKKGDRVVNDKGLEGFVEYGKDGTTGEESSVLGFVTCGDASYLVSIAGKLFKDWRVENETRV